MVRKARRNCMVKLSGDCTDLTPAILAWLSVLDREYYLVVLVGGGTQINKEFKRHGWKINRKHGALGREHRSFAQRQVARDVLEKNQVKVQECLAKNSIKAQVIIPVLELGGVLCHVNGDQFVLTAYLGYDKLYMVTTPERVEKKVVELSKFQPPLKKIEVIGF